jgi:hypothetical protein
MKKFKIIGRSIIASSVIGSLRNFTVTKTSKVFRNYTFKNKDGSSKDFESLSRSGKIKAYLLESLAWSIKDFTMNTLIYSGVFYYFFDFPFWLAVLYMTLGYFSHKLIVDISVLIYFKRKGN